MSAHAHLPPDPIPPPKLVFTISHYKEVLDDLTGKTHTEYFCRLEISYPPRVSKKDQIHNILRRWSHFAWFDNEWARIYPMLHEQCKLPVKTRSELCKSHFEPILLESFQFDRPIHHSYSTLMIISSTSSFSFTVLLPSSTSRSLPILVVSLSSNTSKNY